MTAIAPTLHGIVQALGGDLYQGGRRANVPAPGHSASDRSVSLLLTDDRLIIHGFGSADWRMVLDDLKARGLVNAAGRPPVGNTSARAVVAAPKRERTGVAARLWQEAVPLEPGSLSARYLRTRRIELDPRRMDDLRHHPALPLAVYDRSPATRPGLVAAIRAPEGGLTAIELTYLDPNGRRATGLRVPRKTVGVMALGSAVRLAPAGRDHLVGEGVCTTLSAMQRFDLPGWALLSIRNLVAWSPPRGVRRVIIAGDRGQPGETAALQLGHRLRALGVSGRIVFPPPGFGDWNEAGPGRTTLEGEEGRGRAPGRRGDGPRGPAGDAS